MSELDLFGNATEEEKKPAKKSQAPVYVAPVRREPEITVNRPYFVVKDGKNSSWIINSDCAHLFK